MLASNEAGGHRLKDDKDSGLAEAVHRSVSAGARGQGPAGGAPAGLHDPAPLLPCSPACSHRSAPVPGTPPCGHQHWGASSGPTHRVCLQGYRRGPRSSRVGRARVHRLASPFKASVAMAHRCQGLPRPMGHGIGPAPLGASQGAVPGTLGASGPAAADTHSSILGKPIRARLYGDPLTPWGPRSRAEPGNQEPFLGGVQSGEMAELQSCSVQLQSLGRH